MIVTEQLDKAKHSRLAFSCGRDSLDQFLHENAHQAFKKNVAVTFVAVDTDEPAHILGYYSVSSFLVNAGELPEMQAKRLPRNIPATLIGRLAVDKNSQGKGIGGFMIVDAFVRCYKVSRQIASVAIVVDALEQEVIPFYEQYGFQRFEPGSLKLFIMMETIAQLPVVQERLKGDQEAI